MSLRAIPLLVISFILYNLIVLLLGGGEAANAADAARSALQGEIISLPMMSGVPWALTWGDLIILITLILLFVEIVKSTYTSTSSLVDHGLSMLVFIACLVEFLIVPQAATSVFFILLVGALIDVIAGYTIGIRVARRDLSIGADQ